jgi:transposase
VFSGTGVQLFSDEFFLIFLSQSRTIPGKKFREGMVKKGRKKSMRTVREILRLHFEHNLSQRAIARACAVSPTTVDDYLERARESGRDWPSLSALDDRSLKILLYPEDGKAIARKPLPDFDYLRLEMKKKGVTLQLLWEEYRAVHPDGYGRSQFCELYHRHGRTLDPVMRFDHKAGDKLFVDFSGKRPCFVDRETGQVIEPELFVAVLGASSRIYAVAVASQQIPDWTRAHVGAFEYFGGVPACVIPDQLKSGVKSSCKYDPEINPVYAELCAHYGVTAIPARPGEPRDKAKVENGVLNAQRRILAALRNRSFFSLVELNEAIALELEKLNNRPMQGVGKSRDQLFEELDKPALKALPAQRFELREWKKAKVHIDYHVVAQGCWYSVPYTLIGKEVMVCLTAKTVAILHEGKRVASHARSYRKNVYVTVEAHRPASHQQYLEWTPQRMRRWGESVGAKTGAMIEAIIQAADHPDHAYRKCLGLLRLARSCGNDRLELACERALKLSAIGYRSVKNILDKGLEAAELPEQNESSRPLFHDNVRGSGYYAGGAR